MLRWLFLVLFVTIAMFVMYVNSYFLSGPLIFLYSIIETIKKYITEIFRCSVNRRSLIYPCNGGHLLVKILMPLCFRRTAETFRGDQCWLCLHSAVRNMAWTKVLRTGRKERTSYASQVQTTRTAVENAWCINNRSGIRQRLKSPFQLQRRIDKSHSFERQLLLVFWLHWICGAIASK